GALIQKGINQAKHLGIEVKYDVVLNIEEENGVFTLTTEDNTYQSKTVVFATGKPRVQMDIEGYLDFKSKGIHLCATCDGLFYRQKKVGIIGDRKSTRLNSSHVKISYAVFCLKKKKINSHIPIY